MSRWVPLFYRVPMIAAYFLWELILANLRMARDVVSPLRRLHPAVVRVPLELETDWQITLMSILLALTPGTLSLDVSSDKRVLFVHAMHVTDAEQFRRQIKEGFERRIGRLRP